MAIESGIGLGQLMDFDSEDFSIDEAQINPARGPVADGIGHQLTHHEHNVVDPIPLREFGADELSSIGRSPGSGRHKAPVFGGRQPAPDRFIQGKYPVTESYKLGVGVLFNHATEPFQGSRQ